MNNEERVLKELFSKPTCKFHIRELARITNLNPNTIIKISDILKKEGRIKKENKKHLVEISLNWDNKKTILRKKLFNLGNVYNSGLVEFLAEEYSPNSISLIGSYAGGEDIEKSDIDIVLTGKSKDIVDLSKFEKKLNRKIHLMIVDIKSISKEFFNNLINGVVLYGTLRK